MVIMKRLLRQSAKNTEKIRNMSKSLLPIEINMKIINRDDTVYYLLPKCEARRKAEAGGIRKRFQAWLKKHKYDWDSVNTKVKEEEMLLSEMKKLDKK